MKEYEARIKDAYEHIGKEYPALINTAKDHREGLRILLNALQREANVDKATMLKWLNHNTELHYAIRRK